jgi:type IV pilus assembly protein PilA
MVAGVPDTSAMGSVLRAPLGPAALLVALTFIVGCGGGGKSTTIVIQQPPGSEKSVIADFNAQRARGQDAEAKSNARNMVSQVESCAADYSGSYTHCGDLGNTGLAIGSGAGQVEVQTSGSTYTVTAHSRSGNTFQLIKEPTGVLTRSCQVHADPGGCVGGSW